MDQYTHVRSATDLTSPLATAGDHVRTLHSCTGTVSVFQRDGALKRNGEAARTSPPFNLSPGKVRS